MFLTDFLFNVLFYVVLHFFWGGKQIDFNEKNVAKDAKMGKFHHTEAKR